MFKKGNINIRTNIYKNSKIRNKSCKLRNVLIHAVVFYYYIFNPANQVSTNFLIKSHRVSYLRMARYFIDKNHIYVVLLHLKLK